MNRGRHKKRGKGKYYTIYGIMNIVNAELHKLFKTYESTLIPCSESYHAEAYCIHKGDWYRFVNWYINDTWYLVDFKSKVYHYLRTRSNENKVYQLKLIFGENKTYHINYRKK